MAKPWEERYAQDNAPTGVVDKPWQMPYAAPQQGMPTGEAITGLAQKAAQGLTFGYGDEIMSGVQAGVGALTGEPGTFGERYDAALQRNRSRLQATEKEFPIAGALTQAAGAVANPLTRLGGGQSFLTRALSNAAINGTLGGVAGFGEGEGGAMNRLGSAGLGAATGAAIGAVLPPIAEGASFLAKKAAPYLGLNVAKTVGERKLIEALKSSGTSIDDVKARLDPVTGQPMALADVGGEDVLGLAQYIGRKPGAGMVAAREFVEQRGGLNQSARLQGEIDRAISSGDWKSTADDLIATRDRTAKPLYDAVRNDTTPVNVAPILAEIDTRLETAKGPIRDALRRARSLFLNRNGAPDTSLAGLDETKKALDALMDRTAEKSVDKITRREIKIVQGRLLEEMDAASGGKYAAARDAYAGPSAARDAMDLGKSLLRGDFDETADAIGKLSSSEKDFFRIGVARALDDAVKGKSDTADLSKVRQLWGSQAVRERVAAAFDNPAEFKQFSEFMDREMNMALTNAAVDPRGNSVTAKLLFRDQQPNPDGPLVQAIRSAVRGDGAGAVANLMPRRAASGELSADVAAEIAPYVFGMKAGDRARLMDALMKRQSQDAAALPWARRAGAGVLRGSTVGVIDKEN